jgi:hypothetical protein
MGVVIEIFVKYPGGVTCTDMYLRVASVSGHAPVATVTASRQRTAFVLPEAQRPSLLYSTSILP